MLVIGTRKSEFGFHFIFLVYADTLVFGGFMALANFVPTIAKYEPRLLAISVAESYTIFPTFDFLRIQDLFATFTYGSIYNFPQLFGVVFLD